MKIANGTVVGIDYSLHLGDGRVIDASEPKDPLTYLHGEGQIVPGLEAALVGLQPGDQRQVVVKPEEGYGEHDPRGMQEVQRTAFPQGFNPEVGMELTAEGENGEPVPFSIREGAHRIEVRRGAARVAERFTLAPGETWTYEVTPTN